MKQKDPSVALVGEGNVIEADKLILDSLDFPYTYTPDGDACAFRTNPELRPGEYVMNPL